MRFGILSSTIAICASFALASASAQARDQVRIVGSSTIFPLTAKVSEHFARTTGQPAPVVESTGSGGGFKLFCGGIGDPFPDIVDASRPITGSEEAICAANSVHDITELAIGYDGIVLLGSKSAPELHLTTRQLYLALARTVPVQGASIPNPYQKWSDIDPRLPDLAIRVYGPPPTSGTRDSMAQLLMDAGCRDISDIAVLEAREPDSFRSLCRTLRDDGAYIEAGENDRLIISKLEKDPTSYGLMGFNNLERNRDTMRGAMIEGVLPDYDTIFDGRYAASRPLFLYVKNAHLQLVTTLGGFIDSYLSEAIIGPDGLLADNGLVSLADDDRAASIRAAGELTGK
ncbi:substrate-binding domain-containing protein [Thalassospira sp.]|uniref:substrate-binding domain-containing protein n=1 Tax=Thalassospira sp. TaxID=1912094 RepID=UPI0027340830|nr:substrate-binding domain-containing protein [Thalassospira sp.]MDP2699403.1 substrate-binding domain-containing protein [Thalassospira sp.]